MGALAVKFWINENIGWIYLAAGLALAVMIMI